MIARALCLLGAGALACAPAGEPSRAAPVSTVHGEAHAEREVYQWALMPTAGAVPPARAAHTLTYDRAHEVVLLTAGSTTDSSDWEWNGASWLKRFPLGSPLPARTDHAAGYDEAAQRVVVFGGLNGAITRSDTWSWDGSQWTELFPSQHPPGLGGAALAFDLVTDDLLLFGGLNLTLVPPASLTSATWVWDGANWSELAPSQSPPGRYAHALVSDARRRRLVLFGGIVNGGTGVAQDTWEWDGSTWSELHPAVSPPARAFHGMAFDEARGKTVLYGGRDETQHQFDDTWEWDGTTWTELASATRPSGRNSPLAYDAARRRITLFSGFGVGNDTWTWGTRGGPCTADASCHTGHCVDGVCCVSDGCAACQQCDGTDPGVCTSITGADDADSCAGAQSCNAVGECRAAGGGSCATDADCAGGHCSDAVCCDVACAGPCDVCAASMGATADGVCTPLPARSDEVACLPYLCSGAATCGATCAVAEDCSLGYQCQAGQCVPATGTCVDEHTVRDAQGDDSRCDPYLCRAGACGSACSASSECTSGYVCADARCVRSASSGAAADSGCALHERGASRVLAWLAGGALLGALARRRHRAQRGRTS